MDTLDRHIVNELQQGFPVCDLPYAAVASRLGVTESELLSRIERLLDEGTLTRFGPLYNADRIGGSLSLCAMKVPDVNFDVVAEKVNAFPQVAHNYQRDHDMNMWFVLATERPEEIDATIEAIASVTGYEVINLPKKEEFYVGLHFTV